MRGPFENLVSPTAITNPKMLINNEGEFDDVDSFIPLSFTMLSG